MQIRLTTHDFICITLPGNVAITTIHSFILIPSFVWGKAFLRVVFSQDPWSVPVEEERDVKRLTVFVLPKKLQLLLLLSAQGVDDGDGQPQGLSRITV